MDTENSLIKTLKHPTEKLNREGFGSWGTQTFIADLGAGARIAPWVIKGAMDGEASLSRFAHC